MNLDSGSIARVSEWVSERGEGEREEKKKFSGYNNLVLISLTFFFLFIIFFFFKMILIIFRLDGFNHFNILGQLIVALWQIVVEINYGEIEFWKNFILFGYEYLIPNFKKWITYFSMLD